jgi:DNA polymerase IV
LCHHQGLTGFFAEIKKQLKEETSSLVESMFRKIIHIDMDCFYAAVEVRDDPSLVGKPVGVGGSSGRGVLTTCNYEARKFGCRSAMPVFKARKLCPHIIIKPVRFAAYREASSQVREIFKLYTDLIEPLSLDEAYLDVTHRKEYAWTVAKEIRKKIWEETQLTASAGISCNKMLAKIASDWKKPNGQFAVLPEEIESFMSDLPVRKIHGVGPKSAARLQSMGYEKCGQLQALEINELVRHFGPTWGLEMYRLCRGMDNRPVQSSRLRKSMSNERTFSDHLPSLESCLDELPELVDELVEDLNKRKLMGRVRKVFVKLKFSDFKTTTKECVSTELSNTLFVSLVEAAFDRNAASVRLIGVGVRFEDPGKLDERQLELFDR